MPQRNSYTFKEGLTLMAAKAVGIDPDLAVNAGDEARAAINAIRNAAKARNAKDKAALIREAQKEMQSISPTKHPKLVNALQARLLALQGRGQDTEVAHVARGEMVIPRELLTPEVMEFIAAQAQERGIDPRRMMVGGQASINPATGAEEFGFRDFVTGLFGGGKANAAQPSGVKIDPIEVSATRRSEKLIEPITVTATRRPEAFPSPTRPEIPQIRQTIGDNERNDSSGKGWYGAPRSRGGKPDVHRGTDIVVPEDQRMQPILSGIDGVVTARNKVYTNPKDKRLDQFTNVHVEGTGPWKGLTLSYSYVTENGPKKGEKVLAGETPLGYYQYRELMDPAGKMTPHVHLTAKWNGKEIDPALVLPNWKSQKPVR